MFVCFIYLDALLSGVPVNRLLRAAADLRGEHQRRAGGRGVLRRRAELPGAALHPGRVRHLPPGVPEGVPDGGGPRRPLHLRSRLHAGPGRKFVFVQGQERREQNGRGRQDCDPLPVCVAGECLCFFRQMLTPGPLCGVVVVWSVWLRRRRQSQVLLALQRFHFLLIWCVNTENKPSCSVKQ